MQTIQLEVKDNYVKMILDFLKLLPENVAKINIENNHLLSDELVSRVDDIQNKKIKTISRDELFDDL